MNALICSINSKYIHSSLAAWCLKAGIEKYSPLTKCDVFECTINESIQDIKSKLDLKTYDVIGFCTYIWNVDYVLKLCEHIKRTKKAKIVLGGPEVGYAVEKYLNKDYIDFIITGEGEKTFARLCEGEDFEKIEGLSYKKENKIIQNAGNQAGEILSPYSTEYYAQLDGRIAYIETSRGCPFKCGFCLSGRCNDVRFLDIDEAKKRILQLANSGTQTVKFVDRTFNADKNRAKELFKFIIENYSINIPSNVCFHFEIEATLIDEETILILKNAPVGAIQLEIGIQSFNKETLISINRNRNLTMMIENIKSLISLGNMHIHIDLIAGLPYENMLSFERSFNSAYALQANMLQLGFLKILHGSDLEEKAEKLGLIYSKNPPYQIIETQWITAEEMQKLNTCEGIFDKIYNSGRFYLTCKYIVECIGNPFKIFMDFSGHLAKNGKIKDRTLDELTFEIYNYFSKKEKINENKLRDALVMDRLSTNNTGAIPDFLKIHSPKIKRVLHMLETNPEKRRQKGIKRAISLLSSQNVAVYVDYINQNPVTKRYELYQIDIDNM